MQRVTAFKTSDGKVHSEELDALQHEFGIELRGIVQRNTTLPLRSETVNLGEMVNVITTNRLKVRDLINKYNQRMNGCMKRTLSKQHTISR